MMPAVGYFWIAECKECAPYQYPGRLSVIVQAPGQLAALLMFASI